VHDSRYSLKKKNLYLKTLVEEWGIGNRELGIGIREYTFI
jgi:hypothetical protein